MFPNITSGLVRLFLLGLFLALTASAAEAASTPPTLNPTVPAAEIVNPDGTLNLDHGVNAAIDLSGWQVTLDPARGPVLTAEKGSMWKPVGYGLNGTVDVMTVYGSDVYIGGGFTAMCGNLTCTSGNQIMNRIAKWNGSTWSTLGNGVSDLVLAIAVNGSYVYAGGWFTKTCGNAACNSGNITVNHIARWNGSSWSALGNGINADANTIVLSGSTVYVGGKFSAICGNGACNSGNTTANYIAKWNGSTWSTLGNGVNSMVMSIVPYGTDLYVGGNFGQVCGNSTCNSGNTTVNHVARWNGSSWSALGNGLNSVVYTLAINLGNLYVGGNFTHVCGNVTCDSGNSRVNNIAKWSGSTWSSIGNGLNNWVGALAFDGNDLYAGGAFYQACGNGACDAGNLAMNYVARWNGSTWSPLVNGAKGMVYGFAIINSDIYIGGSFAQMCGNAACTTAGKTVNFIAKYTSASCTAIPAVPTLATPANGAILAKTNPVLRWNGVPCIDSYTVTVRDNVTGTKVDYASGLTVLQYQTVTLTKGKTYRWVVQACNYYGCSKSVAWTFTLN